MRPEHDVGFATGRGQPVNLSGRTMVPGIFGGPVVPFRSPEMQNAARLVAEFSPALKGTSLAYFPPAPRVPDGCRRRHRPAGKYLRGPPAWQILPCRTGRRPVAGCFCLRHGLPQRRHPGSGIWPAGAGMLVGQGKEAILLWTGQRLPPPGRCGSGCWENPLQYRDLSLTRGGWVDKISWFFIFRRTGY